MLRGTEPLQHTGAMYFDRAGTDIEIMGNQHSWAAGKDAFGHLPFTRAQKNDQRHRVADGALAGCVASAVSMAVKSRSSSKGFSTKYLR